jgi:hypothetical protein
MEKYGYKNISSMDDFAKSSAKEGNHEFSYKSGDHVTHNDFIKWGDQNQWGVPGQTRYDVKTVDALLNAAQNVSIIEK